MQAESRRQTEDCSCRRQSAKRCRAEAELYRRAQEEDSEEAWRELHEALWDWLVRAGRSRGLRSHDQCEDVAAITLSCLWRWGKVNRTKTCIRAYAWKTFLREAGRAGKQAQQRAEKEEPLSHDPADTIAADASDLPSDRLRVCMSRLTEDDRLLVEMRFILDLKLRQIGEKLGKTARKVHYEMQKALAQLERCLRAGESSPR